ncbi:MAG: FAD-dependent monooxygenase [Alphaproteobacteria bacterium]
MGAQTKLPVLIAGAGIGGLSAAIALARRGKSVHVLEAESEFAEVGAGLQIGPNGYHILSAWGLAEKFDAISARPRTLVIRDGRSSRCLASMPLGDEIARRHDAPYSTTERRRLYALLLETAREMSGVTITSSFRVASIANFGTPVKVTSTDGRNIEGSALVCADGARSRLRTQMFGGAPSPSGKVAWRATAKLSDVPALTDEHSVGLWMAPNAHLVLYVCGPAGPVNAVAVVDEAAASKRGNASGTGGDGSATTPDFTDWPTAAQNILSCFAGWIKWPLLHRPPLDSWSKDAVTLLGDAAHPPLPFLASGAVMAIEDAEVLAAELDYSPDNLAAAFQRYEGRRVRRTNQIVAASARMGEIYHMDGFMRMSRNAVLAFMPDSMLLRRYDWLYGFRVTE